MTIPCRIFSVNQSTGAETLEAVSDSAEIIEHKFVGTAEFDGMMTSLMETGEFRVGGGAAPLFVIRAGTNHIA
jgi:hypothetical protein